MPKHRMGSLEKGSRDRVYALARQQLDMALRFPGRGIAEGSYIYIDALIDFAKGEGADDLVETLVQMRGAVLEKL